MYSGTTVPKVKNIYIFKKKKKKKGRKEKKKREKSVLKQVVPVQLKVLPVQLNKKMAVAKLYWYNLKFYRYNLSEIGQRGFLNQKLGASSYSICFLPSHKKSPSRLPPLTSFLKISCSARVSGV